MGKIHQLFWFEPVDDQGKGENGNTPCWLAGVPDLVLAAPLDRLDSLDVRTFNRLVRAGLRTIGQAAGHSMYWCHRNIRNFDRRHRVDLQRALAEDLGIQVPDFTPEEEEDLLRDIRRFQGG